MSRYKCAAPRDFSWACPTVLTWHFPCLLKGWRGGEQGGVLSFNPKLFFFSLATSPVCLNSCNLTGLDTAAQMWAHFLRSPMPKPTVLSEQSEDSRVPGIKITADKWGSKWRHTSALSSKFAARFQNVGMRRPFWWSQGWKANLKVSEKQISSTSAA